MNGPDWGGIGAWLIGGGGLVAGLRLLWPLLAKRLRRAGAAALSDGDAAGAADESMLSSGAAMMDSSVRFIHELQAQMQALTARVTDLEKENLLLRAELREVTRMADYRQARIDQLEQTVASQQDEITRLDKQERKAG